MGPDWPVWVPVVDLARDGNSRGMTSGSVCLGVTIIRQIGGFVGDIRGMLCAQMSPRGTFFEFRPAEAFEWVCRTTFDLVM